MRVFKCAFEYDSLIDFMKDRYNAKFNKGKGGITVIELKEFLTELSIPFNKSASRDKLFELLFEKNVTLIQLYERFPHHYGVIKSDYVERFNLTDNEYNRLKRTGFLKVVGTIQMRNGSHITAFDAKQFFEMNEDQLRAAIPPGRNIDLEKARLAREKGLTCIRCNEVQNHYSYINKDKVCYQCQLKEYEATRIQSYVERCKQFLNDDKFVILDTETTGLDWNDEIIELGILDTKGNVLYDSMFKPNQEIPIQATSIHGITNEMVKNCPRFSDEWEKIWTIIKDKTLLIYNDAFDTRMLYQTLEQNGILLDDDFYFDSFCIMRFYQDYRQDKYWTKLSSACSEMDVEIEQNHRATDDCCMVLELIKAIANRR